MTDKSNRLPGEAILRYLDADLDMVEPGDFVICAVTGRKIPIAALRYWSVEHQEPYIDAAAAAKRMAAS